MKILISALDPVISSASSAASILMPRREGSGEFCEIAWEAV